MPILHMETKQVRNAGNLLRQTAVSLTEHHHAIANSALTLAEHWQGNSRDLFLGEMQPLLQQINQLAETGATLNQRVQREVDEWERVDGRLAAGLIGLGVTPSIHAFAPNPDMPIAAGNSWLNAPALSNVSVPFLYVAAQLGEWSEEWPDWVRNLLNPFRQSLQPPSPDSVPPPPDSHNPVSPPLATGRSRLGELLESSLVEEPAARPSTPPVPPSKPATPPVVAPPPPNTAYNVPVKSQGSLGGAAACAPTSVSMILDYYHDLDPQNATATPAELLGMLDKGDFTFGKGMSLNRITDELQDLGYQNIHVQVGAGAEDLKSQLQQGPVITTVRLSTKTNQLTAAGNVTHAVVVNGISADSGTVFVNDPWTGKEVQMPYSDFDATWNAGSGGLYAIRP